MARIAGINLNDKKHTDIALTGIFGIGRPLANTLCQKLGITPQKLLGSLSEAEVEALRGEIKLLKIEGDLRRQVATNIDRLIYLKTYRGRRHKFNLPVHGQRTRSNAAVAKKTSGFGKKKKI